MSEQEHTFAWLSVLALTKRVRKGSRNGNGSVRASRTCDSLLSVSICLFVYHFRCSFIIRRLRSLFGRHLRLNPFNRSAQYHWSDRPRLPVNRAAIRLAKQTIKIREAMKLFAARLLAHFAAKNTRAQRDFVSPKNPIRSGSGSGSRSVTSWCSNRMESVEVVLAIWIEI